MHEQHKIKQLVFIEIYTFIHYVKVKTGLLLSRMVQISSKI